MTHRSAVPSFSGALHLPTLDPLACGRRWRTGEHDRRRRHLAPSGPVDIGAIARSSEGRIDVAVDNPRMPVD